MSYSNDVDSGKDVPSQLSMFDAMKLLDLSDERLCASSLDVAERFDKQHKNVLAAIQALECSEDFGRLNFQPSSYINSQNKPMPFYKLTRDGFSLLVMGFGGPKAMFWKERYIQAFNMMEAELLRKSIEHAEARGRSKEVRVAATDSYKQHGATEWFHYTNNTDAIYIILLGGKAADVRRMRRLPGNANVRNHLTTDELHHVIAIENSITLQLEARKVTDPDDQLVVVNHVTRTYKAMLDAALPGLRVARPNTLPMAEPPQKRP